MTGDRRRSSENRGGPPEGVVRLRPHARAHVGRNPGTLNTYRNSRVRARTRPAPSVFVSACRTCADHRFDDTNRLHGRWIDLYTRRSVMDTSDLRLLTTPLCCEPATTPPGRRGSVDGAHVSCPSSSMPACGAGRPSSAHFVAESSGACVRATLEPTTRSSSRGRGHFRARTERTPATTRAFERCRI